MEEIKTNSELRREGQKHRPLFLIGSGPSLKDCNIQVLKNCYTMSFNRSYIAFEEWGFEPTYFAGLDHVVNRDNRTQFVNLINHSTIRKFFFPDDETSKDFFQNEKVDIVQTFGENPTKCDLDFDHKVTIANSGLFGLQIAIGLLGFKEIYLLGCDANYQEEVKGIKKVDGVYKSIENTDPNHFRTDYYGKGTTYNKPHASTYHLPAWKGFYENHIKDNKNGYKVYNCAREGKLTFFEYKDFKDIEKNISKYERD